MKEPNFFIAGFPRSGTTALYEYLRVHPQVFLPKPKEPGFFALDLADRVVRSERAYLALFREADPRRHSVVGEGTTAYAFSREAIPALLRRFAGAKVILMVRHPLEMLRSLHRYYLFLGVEDIEDFEQAWRSEDLRRRGQLLPPGCGDPQRLHYSRWGRIGEHVQRARAAAPEGQLKVIFYEDFCADPRRVYLEVLEFLGLPDDGRREFPRVNAPRIVRWPRLQTTLAFADRAVTRMRGILGVSRPFGIRMRLLRWNSRPAETAAPALRPTFEQELLSYFAGDIRLLARTTGRDLSHWLRPPAARGVGPVAEAHGNSSQAAK